MDKYTHQLIEYYNKCYKAYLSNINPTIFLHILLEDIIKLINAKCGVIIGYDNKTEQMNIMSHASNNTKRNSSNKETYFSETHNNNNNWFIFSNFIETHKTFEKKCLIMKSIKEQKIITSTDCKFEELFGIKLNDFNKEINKKDSILIQIPLILGNDTKGLMLIYNDDKYENSNISDIFKPFDTMMGVLLNNIELKPQHIKKTYDKLDHNLTYQIILDTLDIINKNIVITDRDLRILYKNNNSVNILNNIKTSKNIYFYDIIPQTISLISDNYNNFYKNKHISIDIENTEIMMDIYVNSVSTAGDIYHIFDIDEKKENTVNNSKKTKNLIAYLSHELRNPIQVISTGVYILSRTVKNIEYNNSSISSIGSSDENSSSLTSDNLEMFSECEKNLSDSMVSVDSIDIINVDTDNMETFKSVIKRVDVSCKNISIIIDDIIDLSKIDNDELIMNIDEYQLLDITDMLYDEYREEVQKKGLMLNYTKDDNIPEYIYTDDTRIYQILSNLITNAIKYSNTGIIEFNISYSEERNSVIFKISDQGKGIREEELDNLFKTYGRTSNSIPDSSSTGLGLCICQKIAKLLGGTIDVNSEFKRGSTFTFTHPIRLNTSNTNNINNIFSNKNIKGDILIIDDDINITSIFKLLLKCINYDNGYDIKIDVAHTGDKALHLTDKKKYSLIYMDIDLDGEDGCIITEYIRNNSKKNKNCPIVAVTANIKSIQNNKNDMFDIFDDILLKPFNNNDILTSIIKYLNV